MQYIEIKCIVNPPEIGNEIVIALLAQIGCESFMETDDGVLAYIQKSLFAKENLDTLLLPSEAGFSFSYEISETKEENWNAVWESNYPPVVIDEKCYIHAPFHEKRNDIAYDIEIEPKMSFGTAHHETTALMISYLLTENCKDKTVLDMGSGTGVLAILTTMRGATKAIALDNDEWAYLNGIENCERNHISNIDCILGDAKKIPAETYDMVIANINRNVLLNDMEIYVKHLNTNGILLLSGFYETEDLNTIKEKVTSLGLHYHSHKEKNKWAVAKFYK
jgi:ribosomal protein L11 methyltransferase